LLALHGTTGAAVPATTALTSLGYSGEHFDAKAQEHYLRARWYDPASGRFNRLDPFAGNMQDPQSLHRYAYVHGDPIGGIDPTGMWTVAGVATGMVIGASIGGLVGGTIGGVDSWLGGGSFIEGAAWGALFGVAIGATGGAAGAAFGTAGSVSVWGTRIAFGVNALGTAWGTGDSLRNGQGWQAAFRLSTGLLGFTQVRAQIQKWTPGLFWERGATGIVATATDVKDTLQKSGFGRWAVDLSQRLGIDIQVVNSPSALWRGGYSSQANRIRLNLAHHSSVEEMAVTFIHEAIHAWGIRGTALSEVIARVGSGKADTFGGAAYITAMTIWQYGGRLPLLGVGEGGLLVSLFSVRD
jgi:RHS repeat-associated protein